MVTAANILTEHDGVAVLYPDCKRGFGVRVVHFQNSKAPGKNLSVNLLYLAPGGVLEPHNHENEEVYFIMEGKGKGHFGLGKPIDVEAGMYMHLPPNAEHGLENTGNEMMKVMVCTSPPNPRAEWDTKIDVHKTR